LESTVAKAPVVAHPAATIVLVRDDGRVPEVLLLRRPGRSGFAANAWVFPGGVVDESDRHEALVARSRGPSPGEWAARMPGLSAGAAIASAIAAIREAWEETGLLLARVDGRPVDAEALANARKAVLDGEASFVEVVRNHGLVLRTELLVYVAHWITPEAEPRRYDTRFFLAPAAASLHRDVAPDVQLHAAELEEARWISPALAIAAHAAGTLPMLPPTVHTLRRLAPFPSYAGMRDALVGLPVSAILPHIRGLDGGMEIEIRPEPNGSADD
jgi:8-oxo-dGTP pyrophosphatase MutT (NUDIX family)